MNIPGLRLHRDSGAAGNGDQDFRQRSTASVELKDIRRRGHRYRRQAGLVSGPASAIRCWQRKRVSERAGPPERRRGSLRRIWVDRESSARGSQRNAHVPALCDRGFARVFDRRNDLVIIGSLLNTADVAELRDDHQCQDTRHQQRDDQLDQSKPTAGVRCGTIRSRQGGRGSFPMQRNARAADDRLRRQLRWMRATWSRPEVARAAREDPLGVRHGAVMQWICEPAVNSLVPRSSNRRQVALDKAKSAPEITGSPW